MNGIDPKWGMYLGLAVIIEQGIGHGTVSLTYLIPADWAPYVTAWANFLAFVGTSIMTYQAAVSGPQKGPLADTAISPSVKAAIVLAVAMSFLSLPPGARAQTASTTIQPNPGLTVAENQVYAALNSIVGFAGGFVQADLNAAIADAQAQVPPNAQAVSCWQAIAKIPVTAIPTGAGLAYLKQKFLDLQSLYMPLNLNCGSVAPLFLKEYNQFMSMAASQNL
jgi:hypothetical protein